MVTLLGECTKCDERRADLGDGFILRIILGITTVVFWIRDKALQYVHFVCNCLFPAVGWVTVYMGFSSSHWVRQFCWKGDKAGLLGQSGDVELTLQLFFIFVYLFFCCFSFFSILISALKIYCTNPQKPGLLNSLKVCHFRLSHK